MSAKENVLKLFKRFLDIWNDKWARITSNYGTHTLTNEWAAELKDFTWEIIEAACEKARATNEWPPSIAEFKSICKDFLIAGIERDDREDYEAKKLQREKETLKKHITSICRKLYFSEPIPAAISGIPRALKLIEQMEACTKFVGKLINGDDSLENLNKILSDLENKLADNKADGLQDTLNTQGMWIYSTQ